MQASHAWRADSAVFDEDNLLSHAGLVPLLKLAEQIGLSSLLDEHVRFADERVTSGAANATPKLTSIIAGMAAGADRIDDLDVIRAGATSKLFSGVYAAYTLGILLREFTHGHTRQLSAVLRRHLLALAAYDVHQARVFGRTEPTTGIVPFANLVAQVMTREPYASARRVFWIVDNGSSHRGQKAVDRLSKSWPNATLVHTPVHASWVNQVEIYFSIVQRKVVTPNFTERLLSVRVLR